MRRYLTILLVVIGVSSYGQTNTFPTSGKVGIGIINPDVNLHVLEPSESKPGGTVAPTKSVFKLSRTGSNGYTYNESAEFRIGHGGPTYWGSQLDLYINGASNQTNTPDQQVMTWLYNGNVGVGTTTPEYKLQVFGPRISLRNYGEARYHLYNGGSIVEWLFGQKSNTSHNFTISTSIAGTETDFITVGALNGNLGIGTANPQALLDVGKYISNGAIGTVLARQSEGDNIALGTSLNVRAWETQNSTYNGKSFSLEHSFYGSLNSAINFYRGGGITGGYITFATNNGQEMMRIDPTGNLGIGTINTQGYKLAVNGRIHAQEIQVDTDNWPDYVFTPDHKLPALELLAKQIKEQGHLPNIPSAEEVSKNGIILGEMNKKLLEKIEELTLYAIKQNEQIKDLKSQSEDMKQLKELLQKQNERITQLEKLVSQPKVAQSK